MADEMRVPNEWKTAGTNGVVWFLQNRYSLFERTRVKAPDFSRFVFDAMEHYARYLTEK